MRVARFASLLLALPFLLATGARAQDHMRCYKVKDPSSFKGIVSVDGILTAVETGCSIKIKSTMLCVPADMTITDAGGAPITAIQGDATLKPQLCYKVKKCPEIVPADLPITDPFGTRTLSSLKQSIVCTPASFTVPTCGDGDINQGTEECDGSDDASCPGACRVDCSCGVCGDGTVDPGESCDTTSGFANIGCNPDCTFDFSTVSQLYCNGACSMGGPAGCDQSDADVYCKLLTGSSTSTANSFTTTLAFNANGFGCLGGTVLGPQPQYGVFQSVRYIDTNLSGTHGSGAVINSVSCLP